MTNLVTIVEYIRQLPETYKRTLYKNPLFATSILKIFGDNTKRFIFDLLLNAPSTRTLKENENIKNSLKILLKLSLITKKGSNLFLNEDFRKAFFIGLQHNDQIHFKKTEVKNTGPYLNTNFEDILKYLVVKESIKIPGLEEILLFSKLIQNGNITNYGFTFLLKSRNEQYWTLIIKSLIFYCKNEQEQIQNLLSILDLSNKKTDTEYIFIQPLNIQFYKFLEVLGLIKFNKENFILKNQFLEIFAKKEKQKSNFILVETNFKVYAYTNSEYQKSIIDLFSNIEINLPNLIKSTLTEESVLYAFNKGITSAQIINFLKSYSLFSDIPLSITNQIEIWELKMKRIQIVPGFLYSNFLNLIDYQRVIKYCLTKDCIVDKDDEKRILIVTPNGNTSVKEFIKRNLHQAN